MEELILKEREFKEKIIEVINNSNLPAFIIKPVLKDLFEQVNTLEQQQYEKALEIKEKQNKKEKLEEVQNEKDNI